jgi:hypothetical protein
MMFSRIALPAALVAGFGVAAAQQPPVPVNTQPARSQTPRAKRVKPAPTPAPPVPVATPPVPVYTPPTPETMPAQPPQVSYAGGMLTIVAENSTLGDIMNAVKSRTGATVDAPGALGERVATRLGPAPPRQVLADLLKGSHYDYVMIGSDTDPQGVRSIILTRNSSAPVTSSGPATASGGASPQPGGRGLNDMLRRGNPAGSQPPEEQPVPDAEVEQPEETPPPVVQQVAPPHAQGRGGPGANPEGQPIQPQPPDMNQAGQPAQPDQRLRTPEELLQELQRMQQQQQQGEQDQQR